MVIQLLMQAVTNWKWVLSIREAAVKINAALFAAFTQNRCQCKGKCNSAQCSCIKSQINFSNHCHPGRKCANGEATSVPQNAVLNQEVTWMCRTEVITTQSPPNGSEHMQTCRTSNICFLRERHRDSRGRGSSCEMFMRVRSCGRWQLVRSTAYSWESSTGDSLSAQQRIFGEAP